MNETELQSLAQALHDQDVSPESWYSEIGQVNEALSDYHIELERLEDEEQIAVCALYYSGKLRKSIVLAWYIPCTEFTTNRELAENLARYDGEAEAVEARITVS